MSALVLPNTIGPNGTAASASPVQNNFQAIQSYVNTEVITRDGATQMTGPLLLNADPVAAQGAATMSYVQSQGRLVIPIGAVIMWTGATAPAGGIWLLADGSLVSTTTYAAYFAVAGYTYGGSGGLCGLPALMSGNGVFPIGAAGSRGRGSTGGSADATLPTHSHDISHTQPSINTSVESATHVHPFTTGGVGDHAHYIVSPSVNALGAAASGTTLATGAGGPYLGYYSQTAAAGAHSHTGTTDGQSVNHNHVVPANPFTGNSGSAGVSATGANMPPYVGMSFLVRVA